MPDHKNNNVRSDPTVHRAWLNSHAAKQRAGHAKLRSREALWSWARLVTFFSAVGLVISLAGAGFPAFLLGVVPAVLFGVSVRRHRRARERREQADRLLGVIAESLERCDGHVTLVRSHLRPDDPDNPDAVLTPPLEPGPISSLTEQEHDDLDFYAGPVGLFGLLNRTSTGAGARRLRDLIERPCLSVDRITARQEAVRWLDDHPTERLRLSASAAALRGRDAFFDRLTVAVRKAKSLPFPSATLAMRLWSVPSGLFLLVAFGMALTGSYGWGMAALGLLGVNALWFVTVRRDVETRLTPWREVSSAATGWLIAARQGATDLPHTTELAVLRNACAAVTRRELLPAVCKWLPWTESAGMIHTLFNIAIFYDVNVADAILSRVVPNRDKLLAGLAALAELDAMISLACFAWEQPVRCYPALADEPALEITAGCHPLIDPDRVVPNHVRLTATGRVWVITGSNMAGKSTFLRMTAIHVLLGQIGTTAAAEAMRFSPMRLITDLSVRDNLARDESYFLAEVRHLRRMVMPSADGAPVFGLIDEPFRGTNSEEQIAASLAVLAHLIDSPHFFIVATHERRLTELADGQAAANYHFREELDSEGLIFDYTLRPGASQTRTALRVLEREGYPPKLIQRAHQWIADAHD